MASSTLTHSRITFATIVHAVRIGSPLMAGMAVAFVLLFGVFYAGTFIDERLINGVSVWDKPSKFFLSLALHMATLAWGLSLLPANERASPTIVGASRIFVALAIFEIAYITVQAARGQASHFNTTSTVSTVMYALMGMAAVALAAITALFGWRILMRAPDSTIAYATGLGFILGAVLAVIFGGYMSRQGGHWVGGTHSDAAGLPFFHWSTTGGDLRVAHFFGLHAMQAIPLAAYVLRPRSRLSLWAVASLWALLTIVTFVQALVGKPLLG
jgi:hypothetical protein